MVKCSPLNKFKKTKSILAESRSDISWYIQFYTVSKHSLQLQSGHIINVSHPQVHDPPSLQFSGLKVLVELPSRGLPVWFNLRHVSNKRFIQDNGSNPNVLSVRLFAKDPHDYFSFRSTYIPTYSNLERKFLNLPIVNNSPIWQAGMTFATAMNQSKSLFPDVSGLTSQWKPQEVVHHSAAPAWDPGSCTPLHVSNSLNSSGEALGSHTPLPLPSGAETPTPPSLPYW